MMTTQTSVRTGQWSSSAAYLDFLQMITGVGLILFMRSHMILVASINLGPEVMNGLARWAHTKRPHHLDTWLWVVQAGTAMIILIMG
jgi:succinate dehydrogenase subunit C